MAVATDRHAAFECLFLVVLISLPRPGTASSKQKKGTEGNKPMQFASAQNHPEAVSYYVTFRSRRAVGNTSSDLTDRGLDRLISKINYDSWNHDLLGHSFSFPSHIFDRKIKCEDTPLVSTKIHKIDFLGRAIFPQWTQSETCPKLHGREPDYIVTIQPEQIRTDIAAQVEHARLTRALTSLCSAFFVS